MFRAKKHASDDSELNALLSELGDMRERLTDVERTLRDVREEAAQSRLALARLDERCDFNESSVRKLRGRLTGGERKGPEPPDQPNDDIPNTVLPAVAAEMRRLRRDLGTQGGN